MRSIVYDPLQCQIVPADALVPCSEYAIEMALYVFTHVRRFQHCQEDSSTSHHWTGHAGPQDADDSESDDEDTIRSSMLAAELPAPRAGQSDGDDKGWAGVG